MTIGKTRKFFIGLSSANLLSAVGYAIYLVVSSMPVLAILTNLWYISLLVSGGHLYCELMYG
jgi:hypothetical protein